MKTEESNSYRGYSKSHTGFWGIVLLVALFFGLKKLGVFWSPVGDALLSWPAFIFGFGLLSLFDRKWGTFLIMTAVAAFFWIPFFKMQFPEQMWYIPSVGFYTTYWWILLAIIAVIMLLKQIVFPSTYHYHYKSHRFSSENVQSEHGDFIKSDVAFGSKERVVFSNDFNGGKVSVAFGSQDIDLRKCVISAGSHAVLKVDVAFGSCELLVPQDWNVVIRSENLFSSVYCRPLSTIEGDAKTLIIEGSVAFSTLEIR